VQASKILEVPLIITEQYPKGLGKTIEELDITHAIGVFPKTKFCMLVPEVSAALKSACNGKVISVILFGIEVYLINNEIKINDIVKLFRILLY
jgi:hypothetical protein